MIRCWWLWPWAHHHHRHGWHRPSQHIFGRVVLPFLVCTVVETGAAVEATRFWLRDRALTTGPVAVPEPGSAAMLVTLLGVMMMLYARRPKATA